MKGATPVKETGEIISGVSIHAPNEGSDPSLLMSMPVMRSFQSTLPMKGATSLFLVDGKKKPCFNPRSQ